MVTGHSNVSAPASGLDAAYRATAYVVEGGRSPISIRADQPCAELDLLLQAHHCTDWAFVSASNPGSHALPEAENIKRHAQLILAVEARGLPWYTGRGVPDHPGWQPEISLLVLGIQPDDALQLASRFGQDAILAGSVGAPAKLFYVRGNSPG